MISKEWYWNSWRIGTPENQARKGYININFWSGCPWDDPGIGFSPYFSSSGLDNGNPVCPRDKRSLSLGQCPGRRAAEKNYVLKVYVPSSLAGDIGGRKSLSTEKNHPKTSQEFSEQFGTSTHKIKGSSKNSHPKVHPNFAKNLGRQILGYTLSGPNENQSPPEKWTFLSLAFTMHLVCTCWLKCILSPANLWSS